MKIAEWVRAARQHKGLTQQDLGDAMGVTKGNVSGWENERHQPSYDQLLAIQALTGFPLVERRSGSQAAAPSMQPILAWEYAEDLPPGEFVMIPKLDVHLSAGNGHDQVEIEFTRATPHAFRADWIREQRLKPNKLAAMTADGESMEPSIFHGDALLVDTSQNEVQDGKVYALWYEGGERVKRLYRLPGGGLRIQSDNPRHLTMELQPGQLEHVRVLGRVVHRSGRGGL